MSSQFVFMPTLKIIQIWHYMVSKAPNGLIFVCDICMMKIKSSLNNKYFYVKISNQELDNICKHKYITYLKYFD